MAIAASFDGTNTKYLKTASAAGLKRAAYNTPFSTCGWVKIGAAQNQAFWGLGSVSSNDGWSTARAGAGSFAGLYRDTNGTTAGPAQVTPGGTMNAGTWYFIEMSFDGTIIYASINGGTRGTTTVARGVEIASQTFEIGVADTGNAFTGTGGATAVDGVGYWNGRFLTVAEMALLYNAGAGRAASELAGLASGGGSNLAVGLTAFYDLEETAGNSRMDNSGNGYHLLEVGGTIASTGGIIAAGSGLVAPIPVLTGTTKTSVSLSVTPVGGTAPYTVDWHRVPDLGTAISSGTKVGTVSGSGTLSFTDSSPPTPTTTPAHYIAFATDSAGTPQTSTSPARPASPSEGTLAVVCIGDSLTASNVNGVNTTGVFDLTQTITGVGGLIGTDLKARFPNRTIRLDCQAVSGKLTSDYAQSGSLWTVTKAAIDAAVSAAGAGGTIVSYQLGTNDAGNLTASASIANVTSTINYVKSVGARIVLQQPTYVGTQTNIAFMNAFIPLLDALADNVSVFKGDRRGRWITGNNYPAGYVNGADPTHPADPLKTLVAAQQAGAIAAIVESYSTSTTAAPAAKSGQRRRGR